MEYFSLLKRTEILKHATIWTNLKDIMPSELNQTQKNKYCVILLILETKNGMVAGRSPGKEELGVIV